VVLRKVQEICNNPPNVVKDPSIKWRRGSYTGHLAQKIGVLNVNLLPGGKALVQSAGSLKVGTGYCLYSKVTSEQAEEPLSLRFSPHISPFPPF
jgi:hypothetical protein